LGLDNLNDLVSEKTKIIINRKEYDLIEKQFLKGRKRHDFK